MLLASVIGREYTERMQRIASWSGLYVRLALRALVNPRLAVDLLRLSWRFRAPGRYPCPPSLPSPPRPAVVWRAPAGCSPAGGWPRRPPFLPRPARDYMRWRMFTAYGDEDAVPPVQDVVNFARWRRETMGL